MHELSSNTSSEIKKNEYYESKKSTDYRILCQEHLYRSIFSVIYGKWELVFGLVMVVRSYSLAFFCQLSYKNSNDIITNKEYAAYLGLGLWGGGLNRLWWRCGWYRLLPRLILFHYPKIKLKILLLAWMEYHQMQANYLSLRSCSCFILADTRQG